jgi:RNA polymerase sigma-70 factor (ECF subfamily)
MSEPMALPEPSDAELMARVRGGDRHAFAELVDRHKDAVVSYLTRLTADRDRAEDLGQETFLRLFRSADDSGNPGNPGNPGKYREQGYLRAYLYRIATNLLYTEERRRRRWSLLKPFLPGRAHEEPTGPVGLLSRELTRQVQGALAQLPLRFRVPLVLHEIEGWTYTDIAAELGCREGTVKSRIHRGRRQLKARLTPYWQGGAP